MRKLILILACMLIVVPSVFAETWISDYGFYENSNEIKAKDRLIDDVNNIFDYNTSANPGGEKIENGRYYVETKYNGGYNGTDADYVYLDELIYDDSEVRDLISDETTDRINVDKNLQKQINKNNKRDNKQDVQIQNNKTAIQKEKTQRKEADNKLNNKIKNETQNRKEADQKLNSKISTETSNRKQADKKLSNDIKKVDSKHTAWNEQQDQEISNLDSRISDLEKPQQIVGGEIRVFDSEKWTINTFVDYSTTRNQVDTYGVRVTFKMGKSYEQERLDTLERRIKELEQNNYL